MARQFPALDAAHQDFIAAQHIFFVGTAAPTGRVNVSPKGMDSLRVLGPDRIRWRNLTGSGNETAGHLAQANRMTLMWCAFDGRPMILRAYGSATALTPADPGWAEADAAFPPDPGARQIYDLAVDLVQTSCGFAVPLMDWREDRQVLARWSADRGEEGVRAYWAEKNRRTIDGFDTGMDGGT
jgi:hypothetical protein